METTWPIFIFGPARSGTTLLRVLLHGHPRLVGLDELNFTTFIVRAYQQALATGPELWSIPGVDAEHLRRLVRAAHRGPRDAIAAAAGKPRWVDNTHTTNDRLVEVLDDLYEGRCVYLLMRRHPGDIVASRIERWREDDPTLHTTELAGIAAAHAEMKTQIPERVHEVRYEDLVADADRVMAGVLEFLGESTDDYCASAALRAGARGVRVGDHKIGRRPVVEGTSVGRWQTDLPREWVARLRADVAFGRCAEIWEYVA